MNVEHYHTTLLCLFWNSSSSNKRTDGRKWGRPWNTEKGIDTSRGAYSSYANKLDGSKQTAMQIDKLYTLQCTRKKGS